MFACNQCDMLLCSLKNIRATAMIRTGRYASVLNHERDKISANEIPLVEYYMGPELLDDIDKHCEKAKTLPSVKPLVSGRPQDYYLPEFKNEHAAALIDCVKHHEIIINFVKILENFLSIFILIKSIQMTVGFCNIMYTFFSVS